MQREERDGKLFAEIHALRKSVKNEEDISIKIPKFDTSTCCGRLAQNPYFEYVTLAVIVFNALYLGYDCDYNARWGKPDDLYASSLWGFILLDNFFCVFFTAEVVIRFVGYRSKFQSCKDASFLFDFALASMMIAETWVLAFVGSVDFLKQLSIMRLLRLLRLLRMGKLLNKCPELKLIVRGMLAAMRSGICSLALMLLVCYVFAIIFTNEYHQGHFKEEDPDLPQIAEFFGSLDKSIRSLLIMGTILDDITACTNAIRATGKMQMLALFMVCVVISSFTLFNMLVGILCEVMEATSDHEKEAKSKKMLNDLMTGFFRIMDMDGNGLISIGEFRKMRDHPEIVELLESLEIARPDFEKYGELLFAPKAHGERPQQLKYLDAVAMILRLRPGQGINCCDFTLFKKQMQRANNEISFHLSCLENLLEECDEAKEDNERTAADEKDHLIRSLTGRADNNSRPPSGARPRSAKKTLASLAQSPAAEVATAPPVCSKWHEGGRSPAISPRAPNRDPESVVQEKVQQMLDKRHAVNKQLYASMPYEAPQREMYHGTFVPGFCDHQDLAEPSTEDEDSLDEGRKPPLLD